MNFDPSSHVRVEEVWVGGARHPRGQPQVDLDMIWFSRKQSDGLRTDQWCRIARSAPKIRRVPGTHHRDYSKSLFSQAVDVDRVWRRRCAATTESRGPAKDTAIYTGQPFSSGHRDCQQRFAASLVSSIWHDCCSVNTDALAIIRFRWQPPAASTSISTTDSWECRCVTLLLLLRSLYPIV